MALSRRAKTSGMTVQGFEKQDEAEAWLDE
jgi:hypothetical protein